MQNWEGGEIRFQIMSIYLIGALCGLLLMSDFTFRLGVSKVGRENKQWEWGRTQFKEMICKIAHR